jgi:hypothetical protein
MTVHEGEPVEFAGRPPIPKPIYGIAAALLGAPLLQIWCLLQGQTLLNFGPATSAHLAYFLFAPISAGLLLFRHPRARLSLYIFTTFEIVRCLRSGHLAVAALALALLIYVQLPSVRAVYPMIEAKMMLARMRGRL